MLTAYKSDVFDALDVFEAARDQLGQSQDVLPELGEVIRQHGLNQHVGISLLHKHFDLAETERLVEEFADNHAYIKPTTDCTDLLPYMWKVEQDQTQQWHWVPLEFVRRTDAVTAAVERAAAVADNPAFLQDLAAKLAELGMTERFGFSILHRDAIQVAPGEILVESTDDDARVLTFSALPRTDVDPTTLTQTLWQFPGESGMVVGAECSHCTHCTHCSH